MPKDEGLTAQQWEQHRKASTVVVGPIAPGPLGAKFVEAEHKENGVVVHSFGLIPNELPGASHVKGPVEAHGGVAPGMRLVRVNDTDLRPLGYSQIMACRDCCATWFVLDAACANAGSGGAGDYARRCLPPARLLAPACVARAVVLSSRYQSDGTDAWSHTCGSRHSHTAQ